ncbi:MAG: 16S rRNA (cytosine(1402)-N(4))-methyltransferase, partial [Cutibacterium sp.]|nr:16S rRNA (cytosine(1402)-N(4))-methyltransferase [Cutibacterium sp.]
ERPDADEVATNPRSASARLRGIERVRSGPVNRQHATKESR